MQDLEELKKIISILHGGELLDAAWDLIDRCESAEKELDAIQRSWALMKRELDGLREQKPYMWVYAHEGDVIGSSMFRSYDDALREWGAYSSGKPKPLYEFPSAQSRDSAEPNSGMAADFDRAASQRDELLVVLKELQESAGYWSEYDVPIGIVERINAAIAKAERVDGEA